jgi:hypothetical protein
MVALARVPGALRRVQLEQRIAVGGIVLIDGDEYEYY